MRFGIGLAPYDRWGGVDEMAAVVQAADELGFDYVSLPDHVVIPEGPEQPRSGVWFPDVFPLAAHLAAHTRQIRFVFGALVMPLRHPLVVAKQLATLDWVTNGRVTVVVGTGWLKSEFAAMGVDFADRGVRTDEYLRVLKTCWSEDRPSFDGRWVSFPPSTIEPKCVQVPHVPLWIGGNGPRPERRVVELGDGWAPLTGTFDERAAAVRRIETKAAAAGREVGSLAFVGSLQVGELDRESLRLQRGHHIRRVDLNDAAARRAETADHALTQVHRSADAGFTHLGVAMGWRDPAELVEKLDWFHAEVIGPVRRTGHASD